MKEIGSEFWKIDLTNYNSDLKYLNVGDDYKLLMSGRTAIDYILNDIDVSNKIVYMPDYCCDSMIRPFIDNGYKISYYHVDVVENKYNIDIDFDCGIFFAMSYFGYNSSNMDEYIKKFNKRNIIIIEDITHRLLSDVNHCEYSSYLIASLRKWFPIISGGVAIKVKGKFENDTDNYIVNPEFVEIKNKSMQLKRDYMVGSNNNKSEFLNLFSQANHMVENYKKMKIDNESLNILKHLNVDEIKMKRIENCKIIESLLRGNSKIKLLYKFSSGDCPLFVPIVISDRDNVRKEMIVNNVYLPAHWPNINNLENDIYDQELSLVNDQRYSKEDIEKYINKLIEIVGE